MGAGKYRDRVTIQTPKEDVLDEDEYGQIDLTLDANWTAVGQRWAEVIAVNGREFVDGERLEAEVSHLLKLHYDSTTKTIQSEMRIVIDETSQKLNIVTAYPAGNRRREMILQCRESP